ncbi:MULTISPECIES: hypothetical protein [unclassified Streptomyces]|uniref:hypothetical protein n=1 Tax=unclassified Streptomyces TaxID=2593676 RepID=UPI002DDAA4DE|nr:MULTISPECIES: hypothetical protein [unclassified Streptomyces]WSA93098.1 hypothetical protein OIE63_17085 [Streptomyces sp. NBC_01795]WSB77467.1 hypothetical protein OHB04_17915 [Streptomyces sp. NBC_01775]WSS14267.1 hypothetical protein OG533_22050 [Streptomyces sp. NBC_01186]WSS43085.1 hypothetical protein OG220_22730 [Streptomyces sp. NBC_01187]
MLLRTTPTPPPRWPEPVDGCGVCAAHAKERAGAYDGRDYSAATDANVLLGRHKSEAHR